MELIEQKKNPTKQQDQFIVCHITDFSHTEEVVSHSLMLAQMLNKGIVLLHISDDRYSSPSPDEAQEKLKNIQDNYGGKILSYAALKGKSQEVINTLPVILNAVAVVVMARKSNKHDASHYKEILKNYSECKIAYLTIQEGESCKESPKKVAYSCDFKKESKNKILWPSYFGRFSASEIHILYPNYKDEGLKRKWYYNMKFIHKFYTNLNLTFSPHEIPNPHNFLDVDALISSKELGCTLFCASTTNERAPLDFFIGTQEERTILNSQKIPVLYLNPRDDIYVLCD